jgi:hypothetical protein
MGKLFECSFAPSYLYVRSRVPTLTVSFNVLLLIRNAFNTSILIQFSFYGPFLALGPTSLPLTIALPENTRMMPRPGIA